MWDIMDKVPVTSILHTMRVYVYVLVYLYMVGQTVAYHDPPNNVSISTEASVTCPPCLDEELTCDNCNCVQREYFCDKVNDCFDFTDEPINCSLCSGSQFACWDHTCVPHSKVCDGWPDCADKSDELDCAEAISECEKPRFRCSNDNKCKSLSEICAGLDTCDDDDSKLCGQLKNQDNSTSCADEPCPAIGYKCVELPGNMRCQCAEGFVVDENDTSKCRDFNECNLFGTCDQRCVNNPGSYTCKCVDGYTLQADRKCRITSVVPATLYVGTKSNLTRMYLNGTEQERITSGHITDMDYGEDSLFWIDGDDMKIYTSGLSGENKRVLKTESHPKPCGLSYDYIGGNLYIVDCLARRISLYNVETGRETTIIGDGLQACKAVVVDPNVGYMFYTDHGRSSRHPPRISRAYMDGSNRVDLPVGRVVSPRGLSLDINNRRLYWADYRLDRIQTVDYNGLRKEIIIADSLTIPAPVSLTMFEDRMYWADVTKMAVLEVQKFEKSATPKVVRQFDSTLSTVKVYNRLMRSNAGRIAFPGLNLCKISPCTQLCVLSHTFDNAGVGYRCMCEAGYQLDEDGHTCTALSEFLMFSTKHSVRAIPLSGTSPYPIDAMKAVTGQTNKRTGNSFVAIDYDVIRREIYFSDIFNKVIFSSQLNSPELVPVITSNDIRSVEGISLDWISGNMYYTDFFAKTLAVLRLGHLYNLVLLRNLGSPRSVVVHPAKGYVFFADWLKEDTNHPFIGRCECDGGNMTKIRQYELGWPNGMCVDYDTDRIYWVDAYFDRLQHSDLDGNDLITMDGLKLVHPFGVAAFKDYIYLSDWKLQSISRVDKKTGETVPLLTDVQFLRSIRVYSADIQKIPGCRAITEQETLARRVVKQHG